MWLSPAAGQHGAGRRCADMGSVVDRTWRSVGRVAGLAEGHPFGGGGSFGWLWRLLLCGAAFAFRTGSFLVGSKVWAVPLKCLAGS